MADNMNFEFEGLDNNVSSISNDVVAPETDAPVITQEDSTAEEPQRTPTDPNRITVQITDSAPIILLFGAPSSGKTMTLVRLARYLRKKKGYSVSVNNLFPTTEVWEYTENSQKFNDMLDTTTALKGTDRNDFLMIKVTDSRGRLICQILEGAGEDYFPKNGQNRSTAAFPSYMDGVFTTTNKKVWIFITEPEWKVTQKDRNDYVKRIEFCKKQYFNKNDKSIILYNKIDQKLELLYGQGKVHISSAKVNCKNEYLGIFDIFLNLSPLRFLQDKYTCKFVPFSTGVFADALKPEERHYTVSHDSYPATLWSAIEDCIKG